MATLYPQEKKNYLELYLNDVYEKECVFKIEKEEILFIQTGIETLVQDLVVKTLEDDSTHKLIYDRIDKLPFLIKEMYGDESIAEVYFHINSDSSLQRYVAERYVKYVKGTIIKVGSFYDGTKNNFPDEFDFIFPFLGFTTTFSDPYYHHILNCIFTDIKETIDKHAKHMYYSSPSKNHEVTRELKSDEYIEKHGPAYKLRFIYSNGFDEQRHIHVDLVPAFKIIDSNCQLWFAKMVREYVKPKTFRNQILAAENSLIVRGKLAFTEIEQHFMKNILSNNHLKVYRIIKYLLNGHGDDEKIEKLLSGTYLSYIV